ncbi:major facilitator superfamily domain-containing protein [Cladorrhinum sp. PSN259]|nr:major facilitator superfamily domain-containing protein [Cladorrhinum sp. PSN259]
MSTQTQHDIHLRESGTNPPSSEPDSSLTAPQYPVSRKKQATVLLAAFTTIALTIGYNQTFGVFQEYYLSPSQDVLDPSPASQASAPTALLAFVGTLCYGLTWSGGILVNPVISRIEHGSWQTASSRRRRILRFLTNRTITVSGVLMMSAGFALASLATSIWQLLLTQGFLVGMGMSLLYFPLLAPAPEYFNNHRATAMGFMLAGGGAGGLALSPLIRTLLTKVGGRWTLRIYALINLVAGLPVAWAVPRSRFSSTTRSNAEDGAPERRNTHVSRPLAARATFIFSAVAAFLQAAGAQLPLAFIPSYTVILGQSASQGANLLAAANAINAVSRILTGYAGDKLGRQNTLVLTLLLAAVSVFAFWLTSVTRGDTGLWMAFIVLYSFAGGGYYALFPALIAEVFGIRQYAAVNAFILFVRGLGTMFGSPVGGQLLGSSDEGSQAYSSIAFWDGALLMGATVCCVAVRWADGKGKGWKWIA